MEIEIFVFHKLLTVQAKMSRKRTESTKIKLQLVALFVTDLILLQSYPAHVHAEAKFHTTILDCYLINYDTKEEPNLYSILFYETFERKTNQVA